MDDIKALAVQALESGKVMDSKKKESAKATDQFYDDERKLAVAMTELLKDIAPGFSPRVVLYRK